MYEPQGSWHWVRSPLGEEQLRRCSSLPLGDMGSLSLPGMYPSPRPSAGTSPTAWVRACLLRSQFLRNTLPQELHSYGLWSVCVSKWVFRLERWLKERLHTGHLWGDSSMWRILCTARVRDWQKPLPHSPHLKGFSLLWMYLEQQITYSISNLCAVVQRVKQETSFRVAL